MSTILLSSGYYLYLQKTQIKDNLIKLTPSVPFIPKPKDPKDDSTLPRNKTINILLLGIDRRSRMEPAYRTDIMILMSLNPVTNRVVLTSVPRDLWIGGARVNALYIQKGWDGIKKAFEEISGMEVSRFILTDFEDFKWIVDAMGGVSVDVQTTFTDVEYPVDATKTYQTVSFAKGPVVLTGERALIYSRSRHGNNGEGSDFMRMRRQHQILKGMVNSVLSPKSIFNPMNIEKAFDMVTKGRMDTNLELADAYFLWDFYKDKDKYMFDSLVLDSIYLHNPPMSEYGGAWVLIPKDRNYADFKKVLTETLNKEQIPAIPAPPQSN